MMIEYGVTKEVKLYTTIAEIKEQNVQLYQKLYVICL